MGGKGDNMAEHIFTFHAITALFIEKMRLCDLVLTLVGAMSGESPQCGSGPLDPDYACYYIGNVYIYTPLHNVFAD